MFFSQDILTKKRDSPLAVVWLAATLGSKHGSYKAISEKEWKSVSIPKVCDYLEHPDQPIALQLTSSLLVGVTRVHKRQVEYLHTAASNALINFRKAMKTMQRGTFDLPHPEAKLDAITIQLNTNDTFLEPEIPFVFKVPFPVDRSAASETLASNSSGSFLTMGSLQNQAGPFFFDISMSSSGMPGSVNAANISLSSPFSARDIGRHNLPDPLSSTGTSPHVARGNQQLIPRQTSSDHQSLSSSIVNEGGHDESGDIQMGGDFELEPFLDLDFKFDQDNYENQGPNTDLSADDMVFNTLSSKADVSDAAAIPTPEKTPRKRAEPRKRSFIDMAIELTDAQKEAFRAGATQQMHDMVIEQYYENYRKEDKLKLKKLKENGLLQSYPVSLVPFFNECCSQYAWKTSCHARIIDHFGHEHDFPGMRQQLNGENDLGGYGPEELGIVDYKKGSEIEEEPEFQVGRAGAGELFPWHVARSNAGTGSSVHSSAQKLGTPQAVSSSSNIAFPDIERLQSFSNEDDSIERVAGMDIAPLEFGDSVLEQPNTKLLSSVDSFMQTPSSTLAKDAESSYFFDYILNIAKELQVSKLFVSDLLIDQPRKTAAAAFYNILRCAHLGMVQVKELSGDIEIAFTV